MQLVRDLADQIFVLRYGAKLAFGTPEQVLSDPRVIDAYLGQCKTVNQ
jgi:branched-chain amino acid transport system ATP-binding protein